MAGKLEHMRRVMGEKQSFKQQHVLSSSTHCGYTQYCNANSVIQYQQVIDVYSLDTDSITILCTYSPH